MSDSSRRKKPLVADKRVSRKPAKKAAPKRKPRKKAPARRGGIIGFFSSIVRWFVRLIWLITSRIAIVGLIAFALIVGYTYTTIPPLEDVLDGRARGSVVLQDRYGDVFAWRGDQFGGVVTAH